MPKVSMEGHATTSSVLYKNGVMRGIDGGMWIYRSVPLYPIAEAKTLQDKVDYFAPLLDAFQGLSEMPTILPTKSRRANKSSYREFHILLVVESRQFRVPKNFNGDPDFLEESFGADLIPQHKLLFGVRLKPSAVKVNGGFIGSIKKSINDIVDSVITGETDISEYAKDIERVSEVLTQAGLLPPSVQDMLDADTWWSPTNNPSVPYLVHGDHLHFMYSMADCMTLQQLSDSPNSNVSLSNCATWPTARNGTQTLDRTEMYFWGFKDLNMEIGETISVVNDTSHWAADMVSMGAGIISVRGLVEPLTISQHEMKKVKKSLEGDSASRYEAGKEIGIDQEQYYEATMNLVDSLTMKEVWPFVIDTSIVVGVPPMVDPEENHTWGDNASPLVELVPLMNRQEQAWQETMLCSHIRANPHAQALQSETLASSGLNSFSVVGDNTGALVGFTERDHQPAYISSTAFDEDVMPAVIVAGETGSGKTMLLLWLAVQFAQQKTNTGQKLPVVIIDPKPGSDHSAVVEYYGGKVFSLDTLLNEGDGPFDPLRVEVEYKRKIGKPNDIDVEPASSYLLSIMNSGTRDFRFSQAISGALRTGVEHGARCIGGAMKLALEHSDRDEERQAARDVLELAKSPIVRACVGMDNDAEVFGISPGLNLIKVGNQKIRLPNVNSSTKDMQVFELEILSLFQMIVMGGAYAVSHDHGVVFFDEAWMFFKAAGSEIDALARLSRSQGVTSFFFTQKVSDATSTAIATAPRSLTLHLPDQKEAEAACKIAKLETTPERLARIMASAKIMSHDGLLSANADSLLALRDENNEVIRGAVAIYSDMYNRALPVEITLPDSFLRLASTRPQEVDARARIA